MIFLKMKHHPSLQNFNNAQQNFFPPFSSLCRDENADEKKIFIPVNIKESEAQFYLELIAPGLAREDFQISLDENILTISADKKQGEKAKEKTIRTEYNFSSFTRSFTLTNEIDVEGISAEYVNGVLVLNLPKKAAVKPAVKQISIN